MPCWMPQFHAGVSPETPLEACGWAADLLAVNVQVDVIAVRPERAEAVAQQHLSDAFGGGRTLQHHGQQPALGEVADPLGAQFRQARTVLPLQTRIPQKLSEVLQPLQTAMQRWPLGVVTELQLR